ncbi:MULTISPECIES: FitA-like ribbon-helix-helix domain-containing protein [unclassified Neorhizobium]|uniref:FitA-like ribbon-helix-helix domain-containing protein n=1 Tax=unclassified Neorhizobium TaxID=2629175 RepID=UPI001FF2AE96|nr:MULTISPECIES: ribbon-helix-helix protein, CopG family [unclassified Neorhizobium]MCJ9669296.1 ribbon-helix-helix protein, CopG family [Neorhizobium sp. SHOUNA12B]MCJ9743764.1 ribbon-helix-helix protein, CopG family [Neorhizobium sp. SHOUNA12A]
MMHAITISLSDELMRLLKARAAKNGRSVEAEVEKILTDVLLPDLKATQTPSSQHRFNAD